MSRRRHDGIQCNGCGTANFRGTRHKCLVCANYDLCSACKRAGTQTDTHTVTHPTQPTICPGDHELYYGGGSDESFQTYTCPYCGRMGFTVAELVTHSETCSGNQPRYCPVCAVTDELYNEPMVNFSNHMRRTHGRQNGSRPRQAARGWMRDFDSGDSAPGPRHRSIDAYMRDEAGSPSLRGGRVVMGRSGDTEASGPERPSSVGTRKQAVEDSGPTLSSSARSRVAPRSTDSERLQRPDPLTHFLAAAAAVGEAGENSGDAEQLAIQFADLLERIAGGPAILDREDEDDEEEEDEDEEEYHETGSWNDYVGDYNPRDTSLQHAPRIRSGAPGHSRGPRRSVIQNSNLLVHKFAAFFQSKQTRPDDLPELPQNSQRGNPQHDNVSERVGFLQELLLSAVVEDMEEELRQTSDKFIDKKSRKSGRQ